MIELGDVVYTRSSGSGRTSISCHVSRDMTVGRERETCGYSGENIAGGYHSSTAWEGAQNQEGDERGARSHRASWVVSSPLNFILRERTLAVLRREVMSLDTWVTRWLLCGNRV